MARQDVVIQKAQALNATLSMLNSKRAPIAFQFPEPGPGLIKYPEAQRLNRCLLRLRETNWPGQMTNANCWSDKCYKFHLQILAEPLCINTYEYVSARSSVSQIPPKFVLLH